MTELASPLFGLNSLRKFEAIVGLKRDELANLINKAGVFYKPFGDRAQGKKKWRLIDNPKNELKLVQARIKKSLLDPFQFPRTMVGGVKGRTLIENAEIHLGQNQVVKLDLKNCFPRSTNLMVYRRLVDVFGCSPKIASIITKLTTFQRKIPQGAPTSSFLANLVLLPLHDVLKDFCDSKNFNMSFWVDDIAVSGNNPSKSLNEIIGIIHKHNYTVALMKISILNKGERQEVVGFVVNKKPNVSNQKYQGIRKEILDLQGKDEIESWVINSIKGKTNFIGQTSTSRKKSLERLAKRVLPKKVISKSKPDTNERFRVKSGKKFKQKIKTMELPHSS